MKQVILFPFFPLPFMSREEALCMFSSPSVCLSYPTREKSATVKCKLKIGFKGDLGGLSITCLLGEMRARPTQTPLWPFHTWLGTLINRVSLPGNSASPISWRCPVAGCLSPCELCCMMSKRKSVLGVTVMWYFYIRTGMGIWLKRDWDGLQKCVIW